MRGEQGSTISVGTAVSTAPRTESLGAGREARREAAFFALVGAQAVAFALAAASGNIPDVVFVVFRALLTL